mgnify:CR=1 FL=1
MSVKELITILLEKNMDDDVRIAARDDDETAVRIRVDGILDKYSEPSANGFVVLSAEKNLRV